MKAIFVMRQQKLNHVKTPIEILRFHQEKKNMIINVEFTKISAD